MLGHKAVLLATVISEPDLQKKVKNSIVLAKPVFICVCVRACMYMLRLLKRQRQINVPIWCFSEAVVADLK